MAADKYLLELKGITKRFPGTVALNQVQLKVGYGEVHALLGENGAGKSTLMKIIMGLHQADEGEMWFDGKKVAVHSPNQALSIGISMIHQELNPVPHLSIADNIFLHREPTIGPFIRRTYYQETKELLKKFDFPFEPETLMEDLTTAQMQMVEIIKAVSWNAKLIIMDEPTSSLDRGESERLFRTIRELRKGGISIIYISHRMEEIFDICDIVSVFRDGTYIDTKPIAAVSRDELISMMVGRHVSEIFPKADVPIREVVFEVKNFSRGNVFKGINFSVHSGEILGFSGLVGAGRSEIMRSIFGLDPKDSGEVYYCGKKITIKNTRDAIRAGIAMVTEDRNQYGLVLIRSILENISLPNLPAHQKGLLINHKEEQREVTEVSQRLSIKAPNLNTEVLSLSGGNQQKVVVSKWIMSNPKVMILDEPTRGIDVGSKAEIHKLICQFAEKGMAIILISSELSEVMGMSDRILVIHEGRINGEFLREGIQNGTVTQEDILQKALGQ